METEKVVSEIKTEIGNQLDKQIQQLKAVQLEVKNLETKLAESKRVMIECDTEAKANTQAMEEKLLAGEDVSKEQAALMTIPIKKRAFEGQIKKIEQLLPEKKRVLEVKRDSLGARYANLLSDSPLKRKYDSVFGETLLRLIELANCWRDSVREYSRSIEAGGGNAHIFKLDPNYNPQLCQWLIKDGGDIQRIESVLGDIEGYLRTGMVEVRRAVIAKAEGKESPAPVCIC